MASSKKMTRMIIGVVLMAAGVGLAIWGYQLSQGLISKVTRVATGSFSNEIMYRYIGGGISFAVGLFLFCKK